MNHERRVGRKGKGVGGLTKSGNGALGAVMEEILRIDNLCKRPFNGAKDSRREALER